MSNQTKGPASGSFTVSFSFLSIAIVCLILVLIIVGICDKQMKLDIKLSEYISMASFGCVTIGLLYNAVSLQYNYNINKLKFDRETEANDRDKIRFTYEVTSTWHGSDMATNAEVVRRLLLPYKDRLHRPDILIQFKKHLESFESFEERKCLISILNYFENLSLLANDNVIDEETLKKSFRTAFITMYNTLKLYIEDEQMGNNGGNSKIFINFVTLTKKWL